MGGTSAAQGPATCGTVSDCQYLGPQSNSDCRTRAAVTTDSDRRRRVTGTPYDSVTAPAALAAAAGGQATATQLEPGARASYGQLGEGGPPKTISGT